MSCSHPTVWGGLCVECGADVTRAAVTTPSKSAGASVAPPTTPTTTTPTTSTTTMTANKANKAVVPVRGGDGRERFAIMHGDERLVVTAEEAARLHQAQCERLLAARRLILVLDLDLTLIHATTARELQETTNRIGKTLDFSGHGDMFEFQLRSSKDTNKFHIKLRPHLRQFFATVSQHFELHMYTMGSKPYAEEVARIIDPGDQLFQGRILSRDACGAATSKDLKRLFPAGDQLAVVIDDRSDVWRTGDGVPTPNLLQIPPFRFFPVFHELNALPQDKHEQYHDANLVAAEADVRLVQMLTVLLDLHARFFAHYDSTRKIKSVGDLLREKRRTVLTGTRLMFSSVYSRDDRAMKAVILQMAVQHGADCDTDLDEVVDNDVVLPPDVTHVVARFDTTSKARAALKTAGVYLVSIDWFMECVARLQRLRETDYPVNDRPVIFGEPRPPFKPVGDDDADDDSDSDSDSDGSDSDDVDDNGVVLPKKPAAAAAVSKPMTEIRGGTVEGGDDNEYRDDENDDDDPLGSSAMRMAQTAAIGGDWPAAKRARRARHEDDDDDDDNLIKGSEDDDGRDDDLDAMIEQI